VYVHIFITQPTKSSCVYINVRILQNKVISYVRLPLWIMSIYLRAGPPEMPLRSWYKCGTKHFHPTMMVWWKWKTQLDWVIKPVSHDLVRRIRFWRIKTPEQDFKYLYWTIRKMLSEIYFLVREHKWLIWSGGYVYGVATISRLLIIIGLFCRM